MATFTIGQLGRMQYDLAYFATLVTGQKLTGDQVDLYRRLGPKIDDEHRTTLEKGERRCGMSQAIVLAILHRVIFLSPDKRHTGICLRNITQLQNFKHVFARYAQEFAERLPDSVQILFVDIIDNFHRSVFTTTGRDIKGIRVDAFFIDDAGFGNHHVEIEQSLDIQCCISPHGEMHACTTYELNNMMPYLEQYRYLETFTTRSYTK